MYNKVNNKFLWSSSSVPIILYKTYIQAKNCNVKTFLTLYYGQKNAKVAEVTLK